MGIVNGAKPKMTELCVLKTLVYMEGKQCPMKGNHGLIHAQYLAWTLGVLTSFLEEHGD